MTVTITGAQVLTHVRKDAPTAADTAWAGTCAAAVTALIARRVGSATLSAGDESEVTRAALQSAGAAYVERDSPHGVQSFGPDGETVRLSMTLGKALEATFQQILGPGIG